jgi:hypothetical protein
MTLQACMVRETLSLAGRGKHSPVIWTETALLDGIGFASKL